MVELWCQDWVGSRSFCWNHITIEDKTTPVCIAPWEVTIHCDDKKRFFIYSKTASARVFGDLIISSGNLCRTYTGINWCAYTDECGDPMEKGHVYVVDRATFENYGKAPIYVLVRDADRDQNEEFYLSKDLTPKNTGDIQFTPPFCEASREYYHSFMYTQMCDES